MGAAIAFALCPRRQHSNLDHVRLMQPCFLDTHPTPRSVAELVQGSPARRNQGAPAKSILVIREARQRIVSSWPHGDGRVRRTRPLSLLRRSSPKVLGQIASAVVDDRASRGIMMVAWPRRLGLRVVSESELPFQVCVSACLLGMFMLQTAI